MAENPSHPQRPPHEPFHGRRLLVASCILWIATMRVLIISSLPGAVSKSTVVIPLSMFTLVPPNSITGRVGDSLIPRQPLAAELESEH